MNRLAEKARGLRIAAGFIAHFEGGMSRDGRFHPYWDPNGKIWTQGFGHTVGVKPNSRPWSLARARRVLIDDLARVYAPAIDRLGFTLNRNRYAATLSFIFNLGTGMLDPAHDFGRLMHAHKFNQAADSMLEYDKSGGQKLAGLTARREAERHLALTPVK